MTVIHTLPKYCCTKFYAIREIEDIQIILTLVMIMLEKKYHLAVIQHTVKM